MLGLKYQRDALRKSTAYHTVQIPTESFADRHLVLDQSLTQQQYTDLVDHVVGQLKRSRFLTKKGWKNLKIDKRCEDETFANLRPITDKIHDICIAWDANNGNRLGNPSARMQIDPRRTTNSEVNGGSMMVDAQFVLTEPSTPGPPTNNLPDTVDLSGPAEFKREVKDRAANELKIVGAVGHIMFNDPGRRFVIAYTIEGTEMRFWYFSRSHIAVGEVFDYHDAPNHFIRFVIFMTFASRVQLGYDPTVVRVRDAEDNIRYRFEVDEACGWIIPYEDLGVDNYPPAPRTLQGEARNFFLTIKVDQEVVIEDSQDVAAGPHVDDIPFFYTDELEPAKARPPVVRGSLRRSTVEEALPGVEIEPVKDESVALAPVLVHKARVHRRIIFQEYCKPLSALCDYGDYAFAIVQVLEGLNYLRLAGYVHRDISPGNCLFVRNARNAVQIKISDLEYARPYDAESSNVTPLTGTPGFMAVEYQLLRTHFQATADDLPAETQPAETPSADKVLWFRFNFLHDVESALWLYCSLLFDTLPADAYVKVSPSSIAAVQNFAEKLFGFSLEPTRRRYGFIASIDVEDEAFDKAVKLLETLYHEDKTYGPTLLKGIKTFETLIGFYRAVEKTQPVQAGSSFKWDSSHFQPKFYRILQREFYDIHLKLRGALNSGVPFRHVAALKRTRAAAETPSGPSNNAESSRPTKRVKTRTTAPANVTAPSQSRTDRRPGLRENPKTVYGKRT
ncbi:hypothetical protein BDZ89DRAFT_1154618 [Hymenopellis radicata]|nr:hypothetical protein BDZ89DRAFT_1154618 [Hymenopellis radicata]